MAHPVLARERISRALVSLVVSEHCFFAQIGLSLKVREDATQPTAWTNGRDLGYNPKFVDGLSDPELRTVLVHEIMHVAMAHPFRFGAREHHRWNQACDHAVNLSLAEYRDKNGGTPFALPPGALADPRFSGQSAEMIYPHMPEQQPGGSGGNGSDDGDLRPYPADSPAELAEAAADLAQAVMQAAQAAAIQQGSLPGEIKRLIEGMRQPAVDWRAALRAFMHRAQDDYSWKRPARRYLSAGLYLPGRDSERCGPIAVAIDTSGSIDGATLAAFQAEVNSIMAESRPESLTVIYCDAAINGEPAVYTPDDGQIELTPAGGGGTDFRPVFDWVDGHDEPAALVYLTDLYGSFPAAPPSYPVLWAATTDQQAPFGQTLRITES